MSRDRRRIVLCAGLLAVACAPIAGASDPSLEIGLDPREFGIEDVTHLTVRVIEPTGSPQVDLGALSNLEVVSGPSTKTEFSWINGASTRSVSFTYVLQAREVGEASIGPVRVTVGDKELTAEPLDATVVPGSVVPQRRGRGRSPFGVDPFEDLFGRRQSDQRSLRVELRQLVNHRRLVLGQTVIATIVLDTTAGAPDGFEWVSPPSFPGWWAQRVEPPDRISGEVVEIDGVRFNRFVVARHVLVPLKTGKLGIPEISARIGFRSASVFGPQQVVEKSSKAQEIQVAARPEAIDGFAGAVGDLRYTASIEPAAIDFGESAVITIELRGNGNLPLVEAPARWPSCAECEAYPPEEESDVSVDSNGIHGTRSWSTTVVPRVSGSLELEGVELAVFDPSTGSFKRQTVGPLDLLVRAPEPAPTEVPRVDDGGEAVAGAEPVAGPSGKPAAEGLPTWAWIMLALAIGVVAGGAVPLVLLRRRRVALPPRRSGETPAERARELQVALERWWLDARNRSKGRALEDEMQGLRRELEAIRFAPGRADHSETVADLEERLRRLMRRA